MEEFAFNSVNILLSVTVLSLALYSQRSVSLKIDTAQFVMVPQRSTKFHQNPIKELVENRVLAPNYPLQGIDWLNNFKNIIIVTLIYRLFELK